jgi:hypothetical protein
MYTTHCHFYTRCYIIILVICGTELHVSTENRRRQVHLDYPRVIRHLRSKKSYYRLALSGSEILLKQLLIKGKAVPQHTYGGEEGKRGIDSSYSFTTSALEGVSGQRHASAAFYPRYPLDRRLGGPQSRSGHRD